MTATFKNIPNYITVMRMVGTVALLFTKPLSALFYIVYAITGITDVLDGFIARKFKLTSEIGAKLDSVADLIFYAVMFVMIMPYLWEILPIAMWCCVALVLLFRLSAYVTAAIRFKRFAATHSLLNKVTGALVFIIPFIILLPFFVPVCWVICIISCIGSLSELIKYLTFKKVS